MMMLKNITLTHFKNYGISRFELDAPFVGICGSNGIGKTNLLDAIFYSCFAKSNFNVTEALNIGFGQIGFRLESNWKLSDEPYSLVIIQRAGVKKEIHVNGSPYDKVIHHIGRFPAIMITPDDLEIINGGGEERRKYLDQIIGQMDTDYLNHLTVYNKVLAQRNSLLKKAEEPGIIDETLLDYYDQQLIVSGDFIFKKRNEFLQEILQLITDNYQQIAHQDDNISLSYQSKLHEQSMSNLLSAYRRTDLFSQRSNVGIHKDDITIESNGHPFKSIASQGQKKTMLFSLKIAAYKMLEKHHGFAPLLLLDDVFEKLDQHRMQHLLEQVCLQSKGQVIITDTHRERIETVMRTLNIAGKIIELTDQK